MTERDELAALAWEAHRRGMSYGQLVGQLKPGEELGIYARFQKARRKAQREREEARQAQREVRKQEERKRRRS